jgi:chromosomal replication initiation ATPase DnaA
MTREPPLALVYPVRQAMGRSDFVVSATNADAARLVAEWRRWPGRRLALCGPGGAGKTHLAHVFMAESGAARVDAAALSSDDAPALAAGGAVVVEDADRLDRAPDRAAAEAALFHLMNLAAAEGAALLVTGAEAPARWAVALPDLASRLAALPLATLAPPDDALLAAVIAKQLDDRGLAHDPALPAWLAARIERSFGAARAIVDRLDAASLAERRPINRRLAADLLG